MKVKTDVLRTYQAIHTWTGICAGLFLFIGFFAGSLTMFKHELQAWLAPVPSELQQAQLVNPQVLIDKAIATYPDAMAKGFDVNVAAEIPYLSWYSQGHARGMNLDNQLTYAFVNEQGEISTITAGENKFADLLDYLHRSAGIVGEIGHDQAGVYILGIAAGLYFLALVSGVIVLLPTLAKTFFALRKEKGASRVWLDAHNLVGLVSLPFHIVIALTVFVFAFHDLLYGGLSKIYGDKPLFPMPEKSEQTYHISDLPKLDTFLTRIKAYSESHEVIHISFNGLNSASPIAAVKLVNARGIVRGPDSDYLYIQPYTYEIEYSSFPSGPDSAWGNSVAVFFSLHFGTYGGDWGRIGYFIMGLLGAFLFYSGNLLWLDKRSKKAGGQSKSTRFMAKLTLGVCYGSMLGVAITLAVGKLLSNVVGSPNELYMISYYMVFGGFLVFAFNVKTQKALSIALTSLVVSCIAIPISSLWVALSRAENLPAQTSLWVEVAALAFALAFYIAKRKTTRNLAIENKDSIWSGQSATA